uniref:microfibril-associated glycoprotein 4-like n=1 Tax=Styela clava TaxID=7725 RepID=UPI0019396BAE|nr:microfibril-associated glycoprotein 4-like [Styela clava]
MTYVWSKRYIMVSAFALRMFCLISATNTMPDDGLCSQIYQMHEYCTRQVRGISPSISRPDHVLARRVGKAGPRGPPGVVNYTKIEEEMQKKFEFQTLVTTAMNEHWTKRHFNKVYNCYVDLLEMEISFVTKMANIEQKMLNNTSEIERKFTELIRIAEVTKNDSKILNETGGVFDIYPTYSKLEVFCDLETDGGGWMVFQRRTSGSTDFYNTWNEYVNGFGNKDDEYWLGLENFYHLTRDNDYELRIDLEDWDGNKKYAKYSHFKIGGRNSKYTLSVGGYTGDAGDSLSGHNGQRFTTKDQDNDSYSGNCAVSFKGAWWYFKCHSSSLNGYYFKGGVHKSYADGVEWSSWKGAYHSLKVTEMKIRPI